MNRRRFFSLLAAPAIVPAAMLMPVRVPPLVVPTVAPVAAVTAVYKIVVSWRIGGLAGAPMIAKAVVPTGEWQSVNVADLPVHMDPSRFVWTVRG